MKISVLLLLVIFSYAVTANESEIEGRPNILLIVADDLGWNDVGYHGSQIETPNIDRLAREGVELDRFYVQPTCSPTRAALLTGKSPMRLGIYRPINKNAKFGIPVGEKLLPQYLADLGYQNFALGKWHVGHHRRTQLPNQRGFVHFYGSLTGGIGYWDKVHGGGYDWQRNGVTVRDDGYATDLLATEAESLLASRNTSKPVFLYMAFQAPHIPNEAPVRTIEKYKGSYPESEVRHLHAAMVDEMDQAIGRVLRAFDRQGLLSNTIIFFTSDNGGLVQPGPPDERSGIESFGLLLNEWFERPIAMAGLEFIASNVGDAGSDNTPLRGGKGYTLEGGVRVPAFIWWPEKLTARHHTEPMTVVDVLPTLLDALDSNDLRIGDIDGRSQLRALQGGKSETRPYFVSGLLEGIAVYEWPWKLIDGDPVQLYNVQSDPYEANNLAANSPDIVERMRDQLAQMQFAPDPGIPLWDVLFDPDTFGGEEDGRTPWPEKVVPD